MKTKRVIILRYLSLFAAILISLFAVKHIASITQGARIGIDLCMNTMIPSLFPMLALSSFLSRLRYPNKVDRAVFLPIQWLSGLPSSTAPVFFFGSLNGYPVGVKTAVSLYAAGRIDLRSAQKAALINVNPGIIFSVLVAGKIYCGSAAHGILLYSAVTISNLLLCLTLRKNKHKPPAIDGAEWNDLSFTDALVKAVDATIKNTASICAWIVLFSAITAPLSSLPFFKPLTVLSEVTKAVIYCASERNLPLCAFSMGFGGICIFLQLLPDLKRLGVHPAVYLLYRSFSGGLSFLAEILFLKIIPASVLTSSTQHVLLRPVSVSAAGTAVLILFCIVFMLSAARRPTPKNFVIPLDYKKKI